MVAAIRDSADWSTEQAAAQRQLMVRRLPRFAVCWLATTVLWNLILVVEGLATPMIATLGFLVQSSILGAAFTLCRADPAAPRVPRVVATACGLLGVSWTALFAAVGGDGDMLAFIHLMLYVSSSLFFVWGWRPALVLLAGTVAPWLLVAPFLTFYVPSIELGTAIVIGSALALAAAEGYARSFRAIFLHRRALQASRDAAESARAEAEAATRAKDQFLATLSHELRSPLNAVLSWTDMLRRGLLDERHVRRALESIERNAKSQIRLIEDLLDISRIAAGKLSLQEANVDLASVVASVVELLRGVAEAKQIVLDVRLDQGVVPVRGDPTRLHQVVENLLSNAVKFTPEGGAVGVEMKCTDAHAEVVVRDTGIGIPPDVLSRIFDRFHQADNSTTRRYGGLGLGLAIARELVHQHGGSIEAESPGENLGSTFRVKLPLDGTVARPETNAVPAGWVPRGLEGLATLGRVRVLVVDDESDARDSITAVLAHCGAEVTPAASVQEAMTTFEVSPPDVLVADLAMPGEDGYELIRQVRMSERAGGRRMPAIAVTALASAEDRRRALAAGFDVHLAKPTEPSDIVAAVARVARGALAG